jgi:transcriptional regulator with XRE-family HTH domain
MPAPKPTTTAYGRRIRSKREKAGMTQGDLADAVGVKQPSISQWETGETLPKAEHAQKLQQIIGVPISLWQREHAAALRATLHGHIHVPGQHKRAGQRPVPAPRRRGVSVASAAA